MEKIDFWIFILFILSVALIFYTLNHISKFMPILKTCEDDFELINKCGCVPCSWKDAELLNQELCLNLTYGK